MRKSSTLGTKMGTYDLVVFQTRPPAVALEILGVIALALPALMILVQYLGDIDDAPYKYYRGAIYSALSSFVILYITGVIIVLLLLHYVFSWNPTWFAVTGSAFAFGLATVSVGLLYFVLVKSGIFTP